MNQACFLILLLFVALTSCAVPRTVNNNVFQSSSPKMVVTIAHEFTYFKNSKQIEYHKSLQGNRNLRNEIDTYYFFKIDDKNMLTKSVVVGIKESEGIYTSVLFPSHKDLDHGMVEFPDENYEFSTHMGYPRMPEQITTSLKEKGYALPKCVLVKQYKKIDLENRKQIKFVDYWEDVALSGYSCHTWKNLTLLDNRQKDYLKDFNKRALEAFTVRKISGDKK
ncbi:MAG: hypothetical protein WC539_10775 [Nitrospirota bacterium]